MSDSKFPPRLFGGPDLIDEFRELGKWCAFEAKFTDYDVEYISLAEHQSQIQALEERLRVANEIIYMAKQCLDFYAKGMAGSQEDIIFGKQASGLQAEYILNEIREMEREALSAIKEKQE